MKTQKEQVTALLKAIETGASEPIAYINANNYRQHNLTVADGLSGFGVALAGLKDFPQAPKVNTVRVFQDGDFVFAHTDYNFFGPKIGFDISASKTERSLSIGTTCRKLRHRPTLLVTA